MDRKPYAVIREYDPEHGSRIAGLRRLEQPPPYLSLFVGDCVYNLRTALDYLAWELVRRNNESPDNHTSFPIFKDARGYAKHAPRMLRGVAQPAAALIESLQPHHREETRAEHPLAILERLTGRRGDMEMDIKGEFTFDVGFGPTEPVEMQSARDFIRDLHQLIRGDLFPQFEPFFGSAPKC